MNILILDKDLRDVHVLDNVTSLLWVDKYSGIGEFEIETALNQENFSKLTIDSILSVDLSDQLMVIETIEIKTNAETGNSLIVKGRPIQTILERRIVWGQTYLTGDLQTGIEELLNDNIINPLDTNRKISNIVFVPTTDPNITNLVLAEQFFGEYILDVISSICNENQISFKMARNEQRELAFTLYCGLDRSFSQNVNPHVIFSSSFDNLVSSDYMETTVGYKTTTLVVGEGEGSSQTTREVYLPSGGGGGYDRRETSTNAKDVSYTTDEGTLSEQEYQDILEMRGILALIDAKKESGFNAVVDSSVGGFLYCRDFYLGDIVQAINEFGIGGRMRVSEFVISENTSGILSYPKFEMIEE